MMSSLCQYWVDHAGYFILIPLGIILVFHLRVAAYVRHKKAGGLPVLIVLILLNMIALVTYSYT